MPPTHEIILSAAAGVCGLQARDIASRYRGPAHVDARTVAAFLLTRRAGLGQVEAGCLLGRHHTTVHYYLRRAEAFAGLYEHFRAKLDAAEAMMDNRVCTKHA